MKGFINVVEYDHRTNETTITFCVKDFVCGVMASSEPVEIDIYKPDSKEKVEVPALEPSFFLQNPPPVLVKNMALLKVPNDYTFEYAIRANNFKEALQESIKYLTELLEEQK